jgi:hypothetical protein
MPYVILSDWMLPGDSGAVFARRWRQHARTRGVPIWMLQLSVAVLATAFTLVMSNVGATVLLWVGKIQPQFWADVVIYSLAVFGLADVGQRADELLKGRAP